MSGCDNPECCNPDRRATQHTQGVWTTCDDCGQNWWCVASEYDYFDQPTAFACSGGCDDGWDDDADQ